MLIGLSMLFVSVNAQDVIDEKTTLIHLDQTKTVITTFDDGNHFVYLYDDEGKYIGGVSRNGISHQDLIVDYHVEGDQIKRHALNMYRISNFSAGDNRNYTLYSDNSPKFIGYDNAADLSNPGWNYDNKVIILEVHQGCVVFFIDAQFSGKSFYECAGGAERSYTERSYVRNEFYKRISSVKCWTEIHIGSCEVGPPPNCELGHWRAN